MPEALASFKRLLEHRKPLLPKKPDHDLAAKVAREEIKLAFDIDTKGVKVKTTFEAMLKAALPEDVRESLKPQPIIDPIAALNIGRSDPPRTQANFRF